MSLTFLKIISMASGRGSISGAAPLERFHEAVRRGDRATVYELASASGITRIDINGMNPVMFFFFLFFFSSLSFLLLSFFFC